MLWSECGVANQDIWIELLRAFVNCRHTQTCPGFGQCNVPHHQKGEIMARDLGILLIVIPGGLTSFLQLINVYVAAQLKSH